LYSLTSANQLLAQSSTTSTHLPETYVYHTLLPTLKDLTNYLTTHVCVSSKCATAANSLLSASYLDIDYTANSPVSITAYWHESATGGKWNEIIDYHEHERCEVGLLSEERRLEDAEIGDVRMGGWLTVVGGDKKPSMLLPCDCLSLLSLFDSTMSFTTAMISCSHLRFR
jgi:hypothetical protein